MGQLPGHHQMTVYVPNDLREKVRSAAYVLGEDIYEFAVEAFENALARRLTKAQLVTIESLAKQNIKNTKNGSRHTSRR